VVHTCWAKKLLVLKLFHWFLVFITHGIPQRKPVEEDERGILANRDPFSSIEICYRKQ